MYPTYTKSKIKGKNDRGKAKRYRKTSKIYFFEKDELARKVRPAPKKIKIYQIVLYKKLKQNYLIKFLVYFLILLFATIF
jgi:hypothetical protein